MIKFNITREEIDNPTRFAQLIRMALEKHTLDVVKTIKQDKQFYMGELPVVKFVFNKAKLLVDTATEMFIGHLPDITTYSEQQRERQRLIEFNKMLKTSDFGKEIYQVGLNASITGRGYFLVYTEMGDEFPRYVSLDPEYTNVVYDNSVKPKPMFGFTLVTQTEVLPNNREADYYRIFVYTDKFFYNLRTVSTLDLTIMGSIPTYGVVDMTTAEIVPHNFNDVPLIEFKNNELMVGDARPKYDAITSFNFLQNDRISNVNDVVKYVLMLKNVRVGNEEEQAEFTSLLKNQRVLALEGDTADAKFLTNPLDQNAIQTLVNDIESQIHDVIPNFQAPSFAQNSSEPALKLKLKAFLDLAKEKERHFNSGLSQVISLTLDFIRRVGGRNVGRLLFDMNDIEIEYSHNLPSNDYEKITQMVSLNQMGLLNPRIALQQLSWIANVEEYLQGVEKPEQTQVSNGNNETNRLRQMMAQSDPSKIDNDMAQAQSVSQQLPPDEEN
jgi:SPP1 family phage portal protein